MSRTRDFARLLEALLAGSVIYLFFMPWMDLEIIDIRGAELDAIAIENYGPHHIVVYLTYLLYLIPALGFYLFLSVIFQYTYLVKWVKWILLLLCSGGFFTVAVFHFSEAYNITMRYGCSLTFLASVIMVGWEIIRGSQTSTRTRSTL